MDIEIFSFFAGIGLLDLGFENAGFKIDFINEYNKNFLYAYQYARRNSTHVPTYGYSHEDIRKYLIDDFWENSFPNYKYRKNRLIGFIGGPPCPDFSVAGKNKGITGENGQLTITYVELIIKRKPDFFILENVKGLYQNPKHKDAYNSLKVKLKYDGYILFDSIENALEYGVPQSRNRLFLIGFQKNLLRKHLKFKIGNHKKFDLDKIMELPWPTSTPFHCDSQLPFPEGIIQELTVEYWFRKNQVEKHKNGKDIFRVKAYNKYITIDEGATSGKSFKRLHRWRFSPTVAYGNNEVHLHPYKIRRISVAEALAIQSAPYDFEIAANIPLSEKFKMVSNGVPVLLATGIALDVKELLNIIIGKD